MPSVNKVRAYDKRTGKMEVEDIAPNISEEVLAEAVSNYLDSHGVSLSIDTDGIVELGGE